MMANIMPEQNATVNAIIKDAVKPTVGHRPGSLAMTDADRKRRTTLYRNHDKKRSERWKNPVTTVNQTDAKHATGDARLDA